MPTFLKKSIIVIAIIVVCFAIYLGSYLPFVKASRFIAVMNAVSGVKSVEELQQKLDYALDFYSPVGQSEHVRFFGNNILDLIVRKPNEEISEFLLAYLESRFNEVSKETRSLNYTQNFMILGNAYHIHWTNYKKPESFEKAVQYYEEGLRLSPNRPQFLYGLFDLYKSKGELEEAKQIGKAIRELWPEDVVGSTSIRSQY